MLKQGDKAIWDGSSFDYIPAFVAPPPPQPGNHQQIYKIIDYLSDRYESKLVFAPYSGHNTSDEVFVNFDQSLLEILTQLDSTSQMTFNRLPNDTYYLYNIGK